MNTLQNADRIWYCSGRCQDGVEAFRQGEDMLDFLGRLKLNTDCHNIVIRGVVLCWDSYHLLLEQHPGTDPVQVAGQVAAGFTDGFNRRSNRRGPLFVREQNARRLKSDAMRRRVEREVFSGLNGAFLHIYNRLQDVGWLVQQMIEVESEWQRSHGAA